MRRASPATRFGTRSASRAVRWARPPPLHDLPRAGAGGDPGRGHGSRPRDPPFPRGVPALASPVREGWAAEGAASRECGRRVSEFTKGEVVELTAVAAERVRVVPVAWTRSSRPRKRADGDYLLAVGTLEPRKNLALAVEAARLAGIELRVVGARGWGGVEVEGWVGEVPDGELAALYRGARCVLYPSLYEGFGLPVLEAMACGVPVGDLVRDGDGRGCRRRCRARRPARRTRSPPGSSRPKSGATSSSPSACARRGSRGPRPPMRSRRYGRSSREQLASARGRQGNGERRPCFLP